MTAGRPGVSTRHFDVDSSSYLMHRRPRHSEVVLNDDYRGLVLLDLQSGQRSPTIPFSTRFAESGVITHWCFQADGDAVLLFDAEARAACYLTLDGTVRHDVDLPFDTLVDIRYVWHGESLWLTSGPLRPWHRLVWTDGKPGLADVSRLQVRAAELSWWQALRQLPKHSTVMRVEPEHDRMLLHRHDSEPAVGVLSWSGPDPASPRTAPFTGQVPRLAFAADTFYVLDEFAIRVVGISGDEREPLPVEEGFEFADLDVVGTTLVVLGNSLGDPRSGRVWLYPLERTR